MRRRTFLTLGVAGGVALAAAGLWSRLAVKPPPGPRVLDDAASAIVTAIVPAMLAGALPAQGAARERAITETVAGVDRAIAGLPPHATAELQQLFALLAITPARRAFAGVASAWNEAHVDEIAAFLDAWRSSGWALKRTAYDALHQLVMAAWYANPASWTSIGYPGPPVNPAS